MRGGGEAEGVVWEKVRTAGRQVGRTGVLRELAWRWYEAWGVCGGGEAVEGGNQQRHARGERAVWGAAYEGVCSGQRGSMRGNRCGSHKSVPIQWRRVADPTVRCPSRRWWLDATGSYSTILPFNPPTSVSASR